MLRNTFPLSARGWIGDERVGAWVIRVTSDKLLPLEISGKGF